ncbi:MAG: DUF6118 family protein [Candidatus Sphingomonas phytovorans]|nr:DUF6118 family protein [Sphingomonas sp.]WEJ99490.1 MAG: DUF6118 family protein [Sphingomonas sp.]
MQIRALKPRARSYEVPDSEGLFAARQQELHARDYGPDLAKILEQHERVRTAILTLNGRPAMVLTPELIASQIEEAGEQGRAAGHQAWSQARHDLTNAVRSLDEIVASAFAAERLWIAGAATAALIAGFVFGAVVPARIAQAAPERWHWPESRAASELGRDGWQAGMRLLEVADPPRLRALIEADRLSSDNEKALSDCRSRVGKTGKIECPVTVRKGGSNY